MRATGPRHPRWRGGRSVNCNGYIVLSALSGVRERRKMEHVELAERALGKPLPLKAVVHHVNEKKSDNYTPFNLVVCPDQAYHKLLHRRRDALLACGNANAHRCKMCGSYDRQGDMFVKYYGNVFVAYHRSCSAAKTAARLYHQRTQGVAS